MDRRTDQQAYFPIEMQFYISVMFLGFPDEIHEEKPSFLDFENNWLRTDGPTDGPSYGDARTHHGISQIVLAPSQSIVGLPHLLSLAS